MCAIVEGNSAHPLRRGHFLSDDSGLGDGGRSSRDVGDALQECHEPGASSDHRLVGLGHSVEDLSSPDRQKIATRREGGRLTRCVETTLRVETTALAAAARVGAEATVGTVLRMV